MSKTKAVTKRLQIMVDTDTYKIMTRVAEEMGFSVSWLGRLILEDYCGLNDIVIRRMKQLAREVHDEL